MSDISFSLAVAVLCVAAVANALHPSLTNSVELVYTSLLGNEHSSRQAAAGMRSYIFGIFAWWVALGVAIALLMGSKAAWSNAVALVLGICTLIVGFIEITSFFHPKHHAMHATHEKWRRWRKRAYKLHNSKSALLFGFSTGPWHFLFAGALYAMALLATRTTLSTARIESVILYCVLFTFPLLAACSRKLTIAKAQLQANQRTVHLLQGLAIFAVSTIWIWRLVA